LRLQELAEPTAQPISSNLLPVTALPFEASDDSLELENPLPAPVEAPDTLTAPAIDPTEEEGLIETLDSASIDHDEVEEVVNEMDEDLDVIPKKDETSILDTAAKPLETKTPTSAGESVVEQRSKMLTLHARRAYSRDSGTCKIQAASGAVQRVTNG